MFFPCNLFFSKIYILLFLAWLFDYSHFSRRKRLKVLRRILGRMENRGMSCYRWNNCSTRVAVHKNRTAEGFKLSSYCLRKRFLFHRFYDRTMQICPIAPAKFHPIRDRCKMGNGFQLISRTRVFGAVETLSRKWRKFSKSLTEIRFASWK